MNHARNAGVLRVLQILCTSRSLLNDLENPCLHTFLKGHNIVTEMLTLKCHELVKARRH